MKKTGILVWAALLVALVLLPVSAQAASLILLQDNFNDNSLDPAKWTTRTNIPQGGAQVNEIGGQIQMIGRGYLVSAQQFMPTSPTVGGLQITGQWTFGADDFLQILDRSDAQPAGGYGETNLGIQMLAFTGNGQVQLQGLGGLAITGGGAVNLPNGIPNGSIFNFVFTDDGTNLSATMTQVGNPANTATVNATSTSVSGTNYVVFHNRESGRISYLDNAVVQSLTLLAPPPLVWDGTGGNDWTSAHWTGGPPTFPGISNDAVVNAGQTVVGTTGAANSLTVNGGEVAVGPGGTLTIGSNLTVAPGGKVSLAAGSTLTAAQGTVDLLTTAGSATIQSNGPLGVTTLNVAAGSQVNLTGGALTTVAGTLTNGNSTFSVTGAGGLLTNALNDQGIAGTLSKIGAGTFILDNTAGGSTTAHTTFQVNQGTLVARGATPLGAAPTLTLAGGTFTVDGAASYANGLRASIFLNLPGDNTPLTLSGASYDLSNTRVFTGTKAGSVLALAEVAAYNNVATGQISGFGMFPGFGGADQFSAAFSGRFTPASTGTYTFRWSNDDQGMMYLDQNNNGIFEASEAIAPVPIWDGSGAVALTAGQSYNFMYMSRDFTGGESNNFWYTPPGGPETYVNPTLQAGQWQYGTVGGANLTATSVNVTANSEIHSAASPAAFGALTIAGGTTLTTSGMSLTFPSTVFGTGSGVIANAAQTTLGNATVTGNATIGGTGAVGISSLPLHAGDQMNFTGSGPVSIAAMTTAGNSTMNVTGSGLVTSSLLNDQNIAGTLTKNGAGTFKLDNSSGANTTGHTAFQVNQGTLAAIGASPLGNSPTLTLNGGTFAVTGAGTAWANGLRGSIFLNTPDNNTPLDLDDAAYALSTTRVFTGTKAGSMLALAETPAYNTVATGEISGFGMFPGFTTADHFVTAFSGRFVAPTTGNYNFRWSNDDRGMMFLDLSNDGTFQASEGLIADPQWDGNATVALTAGTAYNFTYMAQEYGGGESNNFWFTAPGASETRVNPTQQTGMWQFVTPGQADLTGTQVNVTANSTIASNANPALFGPLSLNAGTTLTLTGLPVIFPSTALGNGSQVIANATQNNLGNATASGSATIGGTGPVTAKLTLAAGTQMNFTGSGAVALATLTTNGNSTFNVTGSGLVTSSLLNDQNITGTLNKTGPGAFVLDNTSGANTTGHTTFQVSQGVLAAIGAHPLGNSPALVMSGGTFMAYGTPSLNNGLQGSIFLNTPDNVTPTNMDGFAYQFNAGRVYTGAGGGSVLAMTADPANNVIVTGTTQDWNAFPGFSPGDHFVTAFSGWFFPTVSGSYNFHWNNDDRGLMYIDLNDDGIFQANERVANYDWNSNGNVNLTAGLGYAVMYMAQEFGGGQNVWWAFTPPGGSETIVDPSTQAGMWRYGSIGPADLSGTTVQVTANSEIHAGSDSTTFGALTVNGGAALTTSGRTLTFPSTILGTGSQIVATGALVNLGPTTFGQNSTLTVNAGQAVLGNATLAGSAATINNNSMVSVASLTLGAGNQMNFLGGGSTVLGSLKTAGSSTINADGTGQVSTPVLNDQGVTGTLTKTGTATFSLDNSSGGLNTAATSFVIQGGTLRTVGTLGATPAVTLAGGTLAVQGNPTSLAGLRGSIFLNTPDNDTSTNLDGAIYQPAAGRVFSGNKAGTILARTDATNNVIVTGTTQDWNAFPGFGAGDHFVTAFSGQFIPQTTGTYNFAWNNDDAGQMYIDLNGDNLFSPNERVGSFAWPSNGNETLTAGQAYNFTFMAQEFGGGQNINWYVTPPGGSQMLVNPADPLQAGMWKYQQIAAINMTATPLTVTANSTLSAISDFNAAFGSVTLNNGTKLTTTGANMTFTSLAIAGGAGRSGTLAPENTVQPLAYNDGGTAATLIKAGGGTMILDNTSGAIHAAATTFRVDAGTMSVVGGANPMGGSTVLTLNGGKASFTDRFAAAPAPAGALGAWNFNGGNANDSSGNGYNGTLVGGAAFSSDVPAGVTGQSLSLSGNGYVQVDTGGSQSVFDGGTSMTISAWVKGWPGQWNPFISKNGEPNGWQMRRTDVTNNLNWTTRGLSSSDFQGNTQAVSDGQWHLVTMTYDGSVKNIYVDGVLDASTPATGTIAASGDMMAFGARSNGGFGNFFTGKLDDIYFYRRALTQAEIQGLLPTRTPPDVSNVNVGVTANSTLESLSTSPLTFAGLTINGGTTLTTTGSAMTFPHSSVVGPAGSRGTINNANTVTLSAFADGGVRTTLAKSGAGTLIVDNSAPGNINTPGGSDFRVQEGTMKLLGTQAMNVTVAGGTASLSGIAEAGVLTRAPLGVWTFDNGTANDSSGNGNNGAAGGSLTFGGGTHNGTGLALQSHPGGGGGNVLTVPTSASLASINSAFSIAYWMKSNLGDNGDWVRIFQHGTEAGGQTTWLVDRYGGNNDVNVRVDTVDSGGGFNQNIATGGVSVFDNTWHNVVFTVDSGNWRKYEDGALVGSGTYGQGSGLGNTQPLYMFGGGGAGQYVGSLDDVYLFNSALTASEVASLHSGTHIGAINAPGVNVTADGNGTLSLTTDLNASLGSLTFKSGTLSVSGAPGGVSFASGGADAAATTFGLNTPVAVTVNGPFDGHSATATFTKSGAGNLNLPNGTVNTGGISFQVMQGRLVTGAPMGAANLQIATGANADSGANDVTISNGGQFKAGPLSIAGSGAPFAVRGNNLAAGPQLLTLGGGTVTMQNSGSMPSGLLYQLDAGTLGLGSGSPVGTWADISGNGNNFSQGTAGMQPLYISGALNGKPVVRFDGSDDQLSLNTATNPQTVFIVNSSLASGNLQGIWGAANPGDKGIRMTGSAAWSNPGDGNDFTNSEGLMYINGAPGGSFGSMGAYHILEAVRGSTFTGTYTTTQLGWYFGGRVFQGDIAEVLVFDRVLTTDEANNVGGYLASKYGIGSSYSGSLGASAINLPNTNVLVTTGSSLILPYISPATLGNLALSPGVALSISGGVTSVSFNDITGDSATVNGSISARGALSPGLPGAIGLLTVNGSFGMENGSSFVLDVANGVGDRVSVTGQLTLNAWTVLLDPPGSVVNPWDKFYLFTDFNSVTGPDTWSVDGHLASDWNVAGAFIGVDSGGVYLTGVETPEPATIILLGLAAAGLGGYIRRRRGGRSTSRVTG